MYEFILDIGDYSFADHGWNLIYRVEAAKDVSQARRAYLLIPSQTGIDLCRFCNEYEDRRIPEHIVERLKVLGYTLLAHRVENSEHYLETEELAENMPETLAEIWVFLLNTVNPELRARILPEPEDPLHLLILGSGLHAIGYGLA